MRVIPVEKLDQAQDDYVCLLQGNPHRAGDGGRVGPLDLDAQPPLALEGEEIQLRSLVRGPEAGVVQLQGLDQLLDDVAFPGGADFGV